MAKAYYTDISIRIIEYLEKANSEVNIAVAWFTNYAFFKVLDRLIERGTSVQIIISDSPHNFDKLQFSKLVRKNGNVYVCRSENGKFMHNKFCIIDNGISISGSYNWSLNAENYFENIIVAEDAAVISPLNIFFKKMLSTNCVPFSPTVGQKQILQSEEMSQDNYYYELQTQFEQLVGQSIKETLKIGVSINTDNLYQTIERYGAVGAAKMLSSAQQGQRLQAGFLKLARKHRLDLTFEHLVVQPQFKPLFPENIIQFASQKLERGRIEGDLPVIK